MNIFKKIDNFTYNFRLLLLDKIASDEAYLRCMFRHRLGYKLDINHPKTFNEKLQWMKLNEQNPKFSEYADKYLVREHIKDVLGEEYLIPLIEVYDNADDINYSILPDRFVLKCNHGAGYNIICKDKSTLDIEEINKKLNGWLRADFYRYKREYHYKNIKPKILCEKYMEDSETGDLFDYKFFCISGKVHMIQVDFERFSNHTRNIYDRNWNLLDVEISFPRDIKRTVNPPPMLSTMIEFAEKLSAEFRQVRIDFYIINEKIYFGEMTFFSGAGFSKYTPRSFETNMGSLLKLPID